MTQSAIGDEYVHQPSLYIIELERDDVMNLVHAAHMHSERLNPTEAQQLIASADRLAAQAVYYN
jgi:hypothetical protein